MNPISFAGQLHQVKLISPEVLRNISSPGIEHSYQVNKLLCCVQSQIELSADNLYVFIEVLEKNQALSRLSSQLVVKCSKGQSTSLSHLVMFT